LGQWTKRSAAEMRTMTEKNPADAWYMPEVVSTAVSGFLRRERDRDQEPDHPEGHAQLRDDGAAPILRERDQDGESGGHEADESEERGQAGVPRGRDRTRGLGDLLIDLEQVPIGCVGRSLGRSLDRCERHAVKCRVTVDAA
jgi:hypothetical protein